MKLHYTAEIEGHPETRTEADYNVAGGDRSSHIVLAAQAAISAAMGLAEPEADGWTGGDGADEYIADTNDGPRSHTISSRLEGDEWGDEWAGVVTIDGTQHAVHVR